MVMSLDELNSNIEDDGKESITPKQNGLVNEVKPGDLTYGDYLYDIGGSFLFEGPVLAAENTIDLIEELYLGDDMTEEDLKRIEKRTLPQFYKPQTSIGEMSAGVSQFITGFVGPNKFLKGAGLGGTLVKDGARGIGAGAVSDFTVFDPNEGNLSNMLIEFDSPVLNNRVTQYLAADIGSEEESRMERRLKMTLEGMIIGGPLEVFMGIRAMKKARAAKTIEEKEKIIAEESKVVNEINSGKRSKKSRRAIADGNDVINSDAAANLKIDKNTSNKNITTIIQGLFNEKGFKDGKQVIRAIEDIKDLFSPEELEIIRDGVLTNDETKRLAKKLAEAPEDVINSLKKTTDEVKDLPVKIVVTREIVDTLARQVDNLSVIYNRDFISKDIDSGTAFEKISKDYNQLINTYKYVVTHLKFQIKAAARTTQVGNIEVSKGNTKIDTDQIDIDIENLDGDLRAMAKKIAESKNIDEIPKILSRAKWLKAGQSLYINSLLSSYWTQGVNLLSNVYQAIGQPAARIIGGGVTGLYSGVKGFANKEARKESKDYFRAMRLGLKQYSGMLINSKGMWTAIIKSLSNGNPVLDTKIQTQDYLEQGADPSVAPISAKALELDGMAGTVADWFGHFAQLPSRFLVTGDEFFKQLNYRGSVYSNAVNLALMRNIDITTDKGKKFIQDILDDAFDSNGKANIEKGKFKNLYKESLEISRENTFQKELKGNDARVMYRLPVIGKLFSKESKSMGENIETFLNGAPGFRFLIPFMRTPTNLWRQAVEYTPVIGRYSKRMDELYNSGPQGKADVIGRQLIGTAMVITAADYMEQTVEIELPDGKSIELPKMTGRGPKDYRTRKLWKTFGWQEYSMLVKGKKSVNKGTEENPDMQEVDTWYYKQYNRMDPRFFHWGLIADYKETKRFNPQLDTFSGEMAGNIMVSIMKNIGDKSYTKGVGDFMQLLEDPNENAVELFLGKQISNFTPYNTFRKNFALEAKDFRSITDRIMESYGLGDMLEPKRDIFGEPVIRAGTTIYTNDSGISSFIQGPLLIGRKSEVKLEWWKAMIMTLARDGHLTLTPPKQFIKNKQIDLASYIQKNSKGKDQTALDYWRENMGTVTINGKTLKEKLKHMIDTRSFERSRKGTEIFKGKKEEMIVKEYQKYKEKAFKNTKKQYPQLAEDLKKVKKASREEGRTSRVDEETIPGAPGSTLDKLIIY